MRSSFSLVLLISSFVTACVTPPKRITGPDGTPHQLLSCGQVEACYAEATRVCGGKYKIVNTSNEVSGDATSTGSVTKLLVKCEEATALK